LKDNLNMRRGTSNLSLSSGTEDDSDSGYFTYRPLSNLPTPPPSSRESSLSQLSSCDALDQDESLQPRFRGPAIHLVNLIPSSASLATASVPLVQAILSRANLPLETVALAVCILDSLGAKFARYWRLSCPLQSAASGNKRHTLPPTPSLPQQPRAVQLHIDSVRPEIIILSALVIASKFMQDPQESTNYYVWCWGRDSWSSEQLNATERCIMESLNYRIMPLCEEACITDAMVDMQLAGREVDSYFGGMRQPSPPESVLDEAAAVAEYVSGHVRAKTMVDVAVVPFDGSEMSTPRAA
jgi:hypothetical protein